MTNESEKQYCGYCGKPVGEAGKIYIAGTICQGHTLSIPQFIGYKTRKLWRRA